MKNRLGLMCILVCLLIISSGCFNSVKPQEPTVYENENEISQDEEITDTSQVSHEKSIGGNHIPESSVQEPDKPVKMALGTLEFSENTELIRIEMPERVFAPFESPVLTDFQDFTFGNYIAFVRFTTDVLTAEMIPLYDFALLGDEIWCLEEGNRIYNIINDNFEAVNDTSQVTFISNDGRRIAVSTRLYNENFSDWWPVWWRGQVDIYEDGKIIHSYIREDNSLMSQLPSDIMFDLDRYFVDIAEGFGSASGLHQLLVNNSENAVHDLGPVNLLRMPVNTNSLLNFERSLRDEHLNELRIFSLDEMNLDYVIELPLNAFVNQFLHGQYLVITFYSHNVEGQYWARSIHNHTYLFNIKTHEMQYLGCYMFNPVVSPVKRFVAFTDPIGSGSHEYMCEFNNLESMARGFYIKNLETGKIAFYPIIGTEFMYDVVNWVNQAGINTILQTR